MNSNKHKKHRILLTICLIIGAIFALIGAELLYSNFSLKISRYTIETEKADNAFRIVFISDLHGREFGKDNSRLLKKIADEKPDIIALVGDIVDEDSGETEVESICAFISAAAEIAPVYFGMGNHEYNYMEKQDPDLPKRIAEAGATVLDAGYLDIEINGTPIRIGGFEGFYRTPHMNTSDKEKQSSDWHFFEDFENTDRFKLLLNHIPTNWLDWNYRNRSPVDLVLSGHYHGGVIRIPIIEQGLYAPYVGKIPPYTKGMFEGKKATCILTTGLAGAKGVPRFFNPPEIVVVDVSPGK